ncbi:hypothetical protein MLD38_023340 [Melastoma candidum]|uniref:Uncharacterized protein n=1 Tax=Melastoma candidum TaxID=119954 RepID=A0ACB9QQP1_9MYRT|nr:hypothetical protein MLD38_023340 [Melastoma candidum]
MEEALLPFSPTFQPSPSSSPFATAPSSPRSCETSREAPPDDFPRAVYFSAPSSPARNSTSSASHVPFRWEEEGETKDGDFEFEFSGQLDFARESAFAEELFENGSWIRPWKPPPCLQNDGAVPVARRHPEVTRGDGYKVTSPVKSGFDPVEPAVKGIGRQDDEEEEEEGPEAPLMYSYNRGRNRKAIPGGSVSRRETRSLPPPPRLSDVIFDNSIGDESLEGRDQEMKLETRATPYLARLMWAFSNSQGYGYKRWRLRDLLLFRSVSEGTGTRNLCSKDDTMTRREEDTASSSRWSSWRSWTTRDSFRSNEGSIGSTSSGSNRGRQSMASRTNSVELHYTKNRAVSEEMKRKTYLPYKQGVLGCLGFGGSGMGVGRELARGVGLSTRGQ